MTIKGRPQLGPSRSTPRYPGFRNSVELLRGGIFGGGQLNQHHSNSHMYTYGRLRDGEVSYGQSFDYRALLITYRGLFGPKLPIPALHMYELSNLRPIKYELQANNSC